jgi:hypothetical protein
MSQAASEALLGLFFPVVLGTISRQLGTSRLNASSLTRLLASQTDNIAAALPSGFADLLRGPGLLGALSGVRSPLPPIKPQWPLQPLLTEAQGLLRSLPIKPQGWIQLLRDLEVTQERAQIR